MLQNAYLVAKIGAGTAENEIYFAEILPKLATILLSGQPLFTADGPSPQAEVRLVAIKE